MADNGDEERDVSSSAEPREDVSSASLEDAARRTEANAETPGSSSSVPDSSTDAGDAADSISGAGMATSSPQAPSPDSSTDPGSRADSSSKARATTSAPQATVSAPTSAPQATISAPTSPPQAIISAPPSDPQAEDVMPSMEQCSPIDLSTERIEMSPEEASPEQQDPLDLSSDMAEPGGASTDRTEPTSEESPEQQQDEASGMSSGAEEQTAGTSTAEGGGPSGSRAPLSTKERTVAEGSPSKSEIPGLSSDTKEQSGAIGNVPSVKPTEQPATASTSGTGASVASRRTRYTSKASEKQEIEKFLSGVFGPIKRNRSPETVHSESSQSSDVPGSASKKLATEPRDSPDISVVKRNLSLKIGRPTSPSASKQRGSTSDSPVDITSPGDSSSSSGFSTPGLLPLSGEQSGVSVPTSAESSVKKGGGSTDSPLSTGEEIYSPGDSSESSGFAEFKEEVAGSSLVSGERMGASERAQSSGSQGDSGDLSSAAEGIAGSDPPSVAGPSTSSGISAKREETVGTASLSGKRTGTSDATLSAPSPAKQGRTSITGGNIATSGVGETLRSAGTSTQSSPVKSSEKEGVIRAEPDSTREIEMIRLNPQLSAMLNQPQSSSGVSELARQNPSLSAMLGESSSGQSALARQNPSLLAMLRKPSEPGISSEHPEANSPLLLSLLSGRPARGRGFRGRGVYYGAGPSGSTAIYDIASASGGAEASGSAAGYDPAYASGFAADSGGAMAIPPEESEDEYIGQLERSFSFEEKLEEVEQESNHPQEAGEAVVPDVDDTKFHFLHPWYYRGTTDSPPYTVSSYDSSDLDSAMESPASDLEQAAQDAESSQASTTQPLSIMGRPFRVVLQPTAEPPSVTGATSAAAGTQQSATRPLRNIPPPPPPGAPPATAVRATRSPIKTPSVTASTSASEGLQPQAVQPLRNIPPPPPGAPPATAVRSAVANLQRSATRSPVKTPAGTVSTTTATGPQQPVKQPPSSVTEPPSVTVAKGASDDIQRQETRPPTETPSVTPSMRAAAAAETRLASAVTTATGVTASIQQQETRPPAIVAQPPTQDHPLSIAMSATSLQQLGTQPLSIAMQKSPATSAPESRQATAAPGHKTPDRSCFSPEPGPSGSSPSADVLLSPFGKLGTSPRVSPRLTPTKRRSDPEGASGISEPDVACSPKKIPAAGSPGSRAATPVRGSPSLEDRPSSSSPSADVLLSPKLGTSPRVSPRLSPRLTPTKRRSDPEGASGISQPDVACSPKKIPAAGSPGSRAVTPVRGSPCLEDRPSSSSPSADLCSPFQKLSTESPKKGGKSPQKKEEKSPQKKEEKSPKKE